MRDSIWHLHGQRQSQQSTPVLAYQNDVLQIQILNEGITVEPTNQRIWLTLGFVNKGVGNVEEARAALTKAMEMSPDNEVGKSAASMLAEIP